MFRISGHVGPVLPFLFMVFVVFVSLLKNGFVLLFWFGNYDDLDIQVYRSFLILNACTSVFMILAVLCCRF